MATTFKSFLSNDVVSTRTLLHEAIPLTGTIVSGTYGQDENIKDYSHGMFQSIYDYPYLSSSANHIFDITAGYSATSGLSGTANVVQQSKKINIYNQMAQILVGHDITGGIRLFDQDGDIAAGGRKMETAFFLNFSRLLTKDEIKKGSFTLSLVTGGFPDNANQALTIGDYGAANEYRVNSPAGEYAILYTSSATPDVNSGFGHLYYQAGIAVITGGIFAREDTNTGHLKGTIGNAFDGFGPLHASFDTGSIERVLTGSALSASADGLRNRITNVSFNNTTELNSTIYFCRVNHNDFNYSANPTYLSSSQIRVKNNTTDNPVSYITTIGLYSADNELLAVAKLSEPLKKDPTTEFTLRVRLDY